MGPGRLFLKVGRPAYLPDGANPAVFCLNFRFAVIY